MKNILYINACTRPDSRTHQLASHLLSRLEGNIREIKLYEEDLKPLTKEALQKRDALVRAGKTDDEALRYAKEFSRADIIVISAPYWDLLFPAVLRLYLEAVSICGITFRYNENGIPEGLCKAQRLYYITTAGGFIGKSNFGFDYVKALAQGLYGIKDVRFSSAEGLDIYGADVNKIMEKAKTEVVSQ